MDALSKILNLLNLDVDIYHNAKICGNWQINEKHLGQTCFHVVTSDRCRLSIPPKLTTDLVYGDLIIFPKEIKHSMLPTTRETAKPKIFSFNSESKLNSTGLLCADIRFAHRGSESILNILPEYIIFRYSEIKGWMQPILELIIYENMKQNSLGQKAKLNKLAELIFLNALGDYISIPQKKGHFMNILSDSSLYPIVSAIVDKPEFNWDLDSMAACGHISRSSLLQKFRKIGNTTPMQFLSWWRLQKSWTLLNSGTNVDQASYSVGYQSLSAFNKAFKDFFGQTPGSVKNEKKILT
jgi:AraC-like DNA-binding protein